MADQGQLETEAASMTTDELLAQFDKMDWTGDGYAKRTLAEEISTRLNLATGPENGSKSREPGADRIRRSDVGGSIQVSITRGTGTRDQDDWRVKGKGETADGAIEEFMEELSFVLGTDVGRSERSPADLVRDFQPDDSE